MERVPSLRYAFPRGRKHPAVNDIPPNPAEAFKMFCRNCGHEVKDKAIICSNCGAPIEERVDEPEAPARKWSWFTMFVTIGVIMVLLMIAIIAGL